MNKGIQITLSILLILIIGALVFSINKISPTPENLSVSEAEYAINNNELSMEQENKIVVLKTNQGDIKLEFFGDKAPKTVENFIKLASEGFYDGTRFHRVIKDFMIQGGDPLSKDLANKMMWGTGGPGYQFADEFGEGLSNVSGTISMANAGPNTNGSQFFINTADNTFLDGKHTVFGKVIEGMDIVSKIEQTETGMNDQPVEDMIIENIEIQ
jgi:peptidyl-prolyl cis-trans isomerase B (cyclophilin B)